MLMLQEQVLQDILDLLNQVDKFVMGKQAQLPLKYIATQMLLPYQPTVILLSMTKIHAIQSLLSYILQVAL
jgi:hypothetical protein